MEPKPSTGEAINTQLGALWHPSKLEVLKVLRKADVATSARANKGVCPLVKACTYANWPAAELLVKRRKEKVDNVDEQGQTPLMLACQAGKVDLVKSLLKRNAKVRQSQGSASLSIHKSG
ncbi:hypothetical protein WJX77_004917 [Trebouxia sp. C0004]